LIEDIQAEYLLADQGCDSHATVEPDNPHYILDLLKSMVTVSMSSVQTVQALPQLEEPALPV